MFSLIKRLSDYTNLSIGKIAGHSLSKAHLTRLLGTHWQEAASRSVMQALI